MEDISMYCPNCEIYIKNYDQPPESPCLNTCGVSK
mgnify:CR=1 FL=1